MKYTEVRKHCHFIDEDAWAQLEPDLSVLSYVIFAFLFVSCLRAPPWSSPHPKSQSHILKDLPPPSKTLIQNIPLLREYLLPLSPILIQKAHVPIKLQPPPSPPKNKYISLIIPDIHQNTTSHGMLLYCLYYYCMLSRIHLFRGAFPSFLKL